MSSMNVRKWRLIAPNTEAIVTAEKKLAEANTELAPPNPFVSSFTAKQTERKALHSKVKSAQETQDGSSAERWQRKWKRCNERFKIIFTLNEYGYECSICDMLYFLNDLHKVNAKEVQTIVRWYEINRKPLTAKEIEVMQKQDEICSACKSALAKYKMPDLAKVNGFVYPEKPSGLPELDSIAERLIAPRLPFVQVRRLRYDFDIGVVEQAINIPADVSNIVDCLPRQLDEDQTINVNVARNVAHRSVNLSGYVKQRSIKLWKWLRVLQNSTLYQQYNIKVDLTRLNRSEINEEKDINIEEIQGASESVLESEVLAARQQTLVWKEDDCLDMYDEHAEELSFPSIYFGEPRRFTLDLDDLEVCVTSDMIMKSEIRRRDRRGATPQKVLYMAMKRMRLRMDDETQRTARGLHEENLGFLRSIPNSVQYWSARKQDLLAMIRQLGKPTVSLTLSANELRWPTFLNILNRLSTRFLGVDAEAMNWSQRCTLVTEDPVSCCIYFHHFVECLMRMLHSNTCFNPFGRYRVLDYFTRFDFQKHGSPRANILLWLKNDPKEAVCEDMPMSIALMESLCSVSCEDLPYLLEHNLNQHLEPCEQEITRVPHWPMETTRVLLPMPDWDSRRNTLQSKGKQLYEDLKVKQRTYSSIDEFLEANGLESETYLDIIRATLHRPKLLFKRNMTQLFTNAFNPWLAGVMNTDDVAVQFLLDEFSCEGDVDEFVKHSARGSNLHMNVQKFVEQHPERDHTGQLKALAVQLLGAVELTAQEAAWYLLDLPMSEASREVFYIPTVWPNERQNLPNVALIRRYEQRPLELEDVYLAEFVAWYAHNDDCSDEDNVHEEEVENDRNTKRTQARFIRYHQYNQDDRINHEREMVLLFLRFRNENAEILDKNMFLTLYSDNEQLIGQRRKLFEWSDDIEMQMDEQQTLCNDVPGQAEGLLKKGSKDPLSLITNGAVVDISMDLQNDAKSLRPLPPLVALSLVEDKQEKNALQRTRDKETEAVEEEEDYCDVYGKLTANKLSRYSRAMRASIMYKIDGLLLEFDPEDP